MSGLLKVSVVGMAAVLRKAAETNAEAVQPIIAGIAEELGANNPRFDSMLFLVACGGALPAAPVKAPPAKPGPKPKDAAKGPPAKS